MHTHIPYINLLEHLQLEGLYLGHEELHALLAMLVQQALGVLVHRRAPLPTQGAQDNAEPLCLPRFQDLIPVAGDMTSCSFTL